MGNKTAYDRSFKKEAVKNSSGILNSFDSAITKSTPSGIFFYTEVFG